LPIGRKSVEYRETNCSKLDVSPFVRAVAMLDSLVFANSDVQLWPDDAALPSTRRMLPLDVLALPAAPVVALALLALTGVPMSVPYPDDTELLGFAVSV
jgi:hypothetical protein